jgi:hypothetical protein
MVAEVEADFMVEAVAVASMVAAAAGAAANLQTASDCDVK